jgi:methionyl-tRNA synthetase
MISIEDFKKIKISVGKILSAEKVPDTDKLLKLSVDFGLISTEDGDAARDVRQIISGISLYFPDCAELIGKKCMFVTNLQPREIRGLRSEGMILAISTREGLFSLIVPEKDIEEGASAK